MERSWCLWQTTSGQEFSASGNPELFEDPKHIPPDSLHRRGIIHECPVVTVEEVQHRRGRNPIVQEVQYPALPGYLFLLLSAEEWNDLVDRPIKHLRSTFQWLSRHDVKQMLEFIAKIEVMETIKEFQPGDQIEDALDIFKAMRFVRLVNNGSLVEARTEMMGQEVRIQLPPERVRPAN